MNKVVALRYKSCNFQITYPEWRHTMLVVVGEYLFKLRVWKTYSNKRMLRLPYICNLASQQQRIQFAGVNLQIIFQFDTKKRIKKTGKTSVWVHRIKIEEIWYHFGYISQLSYVRCHSSYNPFISESLGRLWSLFHTPNPTAGSTFSWRLNSLPIFCEGSQTQGLVSI